MEFQTLSHAGLRVRVGATELLCDPWVTGSVYWRSWWNYPPVPKDLVAGLKPDFIYLTHLHWDHFQAASLRRFDPAVPVLVPFDRYGRMVRDLRAVGRTDIREVRHGERVVLGPNLAITSFHFSPTITDSAVVIEADGRVLLNANDAKFAGAPLAQILRLFPNVDFCFRSHSSANARACYHYLDRPDALVDDNDRYVHAFSAFMARVKPKYAIPFASNSCLLHDDVVGMNDLVQTPLAVRAFFEDYAADAGLDTKLQIMVPGDRWTDEDGFVLSDHDYFTNRDSHLAAYRDRVRPALDKQDQLEAKVRVPLNLVTKFFAKLRQDTPGLLLRRLKGQPILLVARTGDAATGFAVNLAAGTTQSVDAADFGSYDARIEFPALILRQALTANMFGHAAISKRVHYYATEAAMPALKRFVLVLDLVEAELFPLRGHFTSRAIRALLPRWREGLLYGRAAIDIARGIPAPDLEIAYLEGKRRPRREVARPSGRATSSGGVKAYASSSNVTATSALADSRTLSPSTSATRPLEI